MLAVERALGRVGEDDRLALRRGGVGVRERLGGGPRRQVAERRLRKASKRRHSDPDDIGLAAPIPPAPLAEADFVRHDCTMIAAIGPAIKRRPEP